MRFYILLLATCISFKGFSGETFPIVGCSSTPSKYEIVLMTELRDKNTQIAEFRLAANKIGEILVNKVVECLPLMPVQIESPVTSCKGGMMTEQLELVSIMRSGDALLETFIAHFPQAKVSKFLIQRNEETAEAEFKYMKLSPTLAADRFVIITEPMIATGGSLTTAINMLKERGVKEEKIIVASICCAPEGLALLSKAFPKIKVVMTVIDDRLNERKYIVPGLGDFGDRYFGT